MLRGNWGCLQKRKKNESSRQQQVTNFAVSQGSQPAWGQRTQPLGASISSSDGVGAWWDIPGLSDSPHLVFSRLWLNKYELIHWGFLVLTDGLSWAPDAWAPSPWACLPGSQGARPPWLLLPASQSFPSDPGATKPHGTPGGARVVWLGLSMGILLLQPRGQGWTQGTQGWLRTEGLCAGVREGQL